MSELPAVVVAIPAHDEAHSIRTTLRSVIKAIRHAQRRHLISSATVQVAAHRCTDDTAVQARSALPQDMADGVVVDETSTTIGQVRDAAARRGLGVLREPPERCWIFSTDADTVVPRSWMADVVLHARRHAVTAVVGMAELDRFRGTAHAEAAYNLLLDAKLVEGDLLREHDHVYGANLVIRADCYLRIGGFPHVAHGEDQQLVDDLLAHGARVLRTRDLTVVTSGRLRGRAPDGLATLLRRLEDTGRDVGRGVLETPQSGGDGDTTGIAAATARRPLHT